MLHSYVYIRVYLGLFVYLRWFEVDEPNNNGVFGLCGFLGIPVELFHYEVQ